MNENWKIETRAVQCGYTPGNGDPRVLPLYQSTTFKYDDAQSVADLFDLKRDGFFYTRLANPTVDAFEKRMAALEGGVAAVAVSSGQTATMLSMLNLASAGDHILAVSSLYGGSVSLLTNTFHKMGIEVSFVRPHDDSATVAAAIRPNTKAIFAEALANPALVVLDIERFAGIAHAAGIPLIVDNTFPTPCLCRPFEFGADIVTHSTSKYADGHAQCVGGIIIEKGGFNWKNGKFPDLCEPDPAYHGLVYTDNFAACPYSVKLRAQFIRDMGVPMAPFNAFLTNLGLETLPLRMERHSRNALAMAEFLEAHPKVSWVNLRGQGRQGRRRAGDELPPAGRDRRPRRRRADLRAPSGQHDPPAAYRCRTGGGRGVARHDPAFGRHREHRRSQGGFRPGAGQRLTRCCCFTSAGRS